MIVKNNVNRPAIIPAAVNPPIIGDCKLKLILYTKIIFFAKYVKIFKYNYIIVKLYIIL